MTNRAVSARSTPGVAGSRGRHADRATANPAPSVRFAAAARSLAGAARRRGLVPPAYRSPPRLPGAERSIRWRPDGGATVAVRIRSRPWPAVLADMVEGVVAANRLRGIDADQCRTALWSAVEGGGLQAA